MLDAPILLNGKLVGVVCHEHTGTPRHWSHDEQAFAASIADMVAAALEAAQRAKAEQNLHEHAHTLNVLNRISSSLSGELDMATVIQMVVDAGTEISGAELGAFFHHTGEPGHEYRLYSVTGAPREVFERLSLPEPGELFARGIIRAEQVEHDAGDAALVRSYLAAPVISRAGKVIGGMFFGHSQPGVFTERAERLVGGLAAHAAVAIDNAQLFGQVQQELRERSRAEKALERLNATLEARVQERTSELDKRMSQLRALAAQVHRVEQRERARLARILHDHLQQLLVAAMIQLDLAGKGRGKSARAISEHAGRLVREAIEVSRSLTADLSPPVLYEGSLTAALNWLARHMSERHSLHVEVDASEIETPEGLTEDRRVLLFQSVRELLFNVVKHAGVDRARIGLRLFEDRVEVVVEDAGCGLSRSAEASVAHSAKGTGFGLLSMRERLEYVGGGLSIESQAGRYTRVTVCVPLDASVAEVAAEPATPEEAGASSEAEPVGAAVPEARRGNGRRRTTRRKIRVLLADDHKVLRDGLAGLIRAQNGIEVVGEASNGQEAVDLTGRLRPDLIVMDISMPVLNGIEATRRVTQQWPGTRVVGLSMHEEADMTAAMLEAGAEAYLTKGGPAEDLIAAIYGKTEAAPEPSHVQQS